MYIFGDFKLSLWFNINSIILNKYTFFIKKTHLKNIYKTRFALRMLFFFNNVIYIFIETNSTHQTITATK